MIGIENGIERKEVVNFSLWRMWGSHNESWKLNKVLINEKSAAIVK